jgi:L-ascorbate metabolism protein UlaG (beta-lactamase superfamily)
MEMCARFQRISLLALLLALSHPLAATVAEAGALQAQAPPAKPEMMENCPGLVAARPAPLPVALRLAALASDQVRLTYIGHSTFLIETARLVRIATDYNDYVKPAILPDIVTMNHAHSTHYTLRPESGIKHVLRGWSDNEAPARHDVTVLDVRVRNVPTNIRSWESGGTERHGNSIFVFETANLCIAHLGHLHHTLTQPQLNEIGRIDIVMVPVDGTYTLDLEGMIEVIQALKAHVVIPMHSFSAFTLNRFLERVQAQGWDVERADVPSFVASKAALPAKPKVLVLPGR